MISQINRRLLAEFITIVEEGLHGERQLPDGLPCGLCVRLLVSEQVLKEVG